MKCLTEQIPSYTKLCSKIKQSDPRQVKCNVTSSFEADVFVASSGGLDPDELMKEFQRQSPGGMSFSCPVNVTNTGFILSQ